MNKRLVALLLTAGMIGIAGCGSSSSDSVSSSSIETTSVSQGSAAKETTVSEVPDVSVSASGPLDPSSITADAETLKTVAEAQEEDLKKRLTDQSDQLISSIDTYDAYKKNADQVKAFYDTIVLETKKTAILFRKDSAVYASALIESGEDTEDIYNDLDNITDDIYNGVLDDMSDDIYNGLLDDLCDAFYNGVLDDSDAADDYNDWSDTCSSEYNNWSDCTSDVYEVWSDACSDIYQFVSDLGSDVYQGDLDDARDDINDFNDDIDRLTSSLGEADTAEKNENTGAVSQESGKTEAPASSENAGAESPSDSAANINMKTSDEYSSKIPAIKDYFSQDPAQAVESDAGLSDMFSYANMDEVHAYVDALKSAGFTTDPAEADTGKIYQYSATNADGYYIVLTCQYVAAEGVEPYTSLNVTKK